MIFSGQVSYLANQWSEPENLKYPVNTTDDNLFYYPWHNARIIYASLIRPGGFGKEDIYAIQPENDKPLDDVLAELVKPAAEPVAAVAVIAETAVTTAASTSGVPSTSTPAEVKGTAKETVPETAAAPAVVPPAAAVSAPAATEAPTPREIDLTPVYFNFDNFLLTADGEAQLQKIGRLMKDFPCRAREVDRPCRCQGYS